MRLELDKDVRSEAIRSIERYFAENLEQRIGNIQAGALLNYFVEEIGPCLYNRGVADAQERMQVRAAELDIECHEEAFGYWGRHERAQRAPRTRKDTP